MWRPDNRESELLPGSESETMYNQYEGPTVLGIPERWERVLCYVLGWVSGIFFLIVEPQGLARLWQITKEKLRLWPFPH